LRRAIERLRKKPAVIIGCFAGAGLLFSNFCKDQ